MTTTLNRDQREALTTLHKEQTDAAAAWVAEGDMKRANRAHGMADGIVKAVAIITETPEGDVYALFTEAADE